MSHSWGSKGEFLRGLCYILSVLESVIKVYKTYMPY